MGNERDRNKQPYGGPFLTALVEGVGPSEVARLVLVGKAASSTAIRPKILKAAGDVLREAAISCRYLLTPAGFLKVECSDQWTGPLSWSSSASEWKQLAQMAASAVSDEMAAIDQPFVGTVERLVVGVDIKFQKRGRLTPVGQAAVLWDVASATVLDVTGKSYPQSGSETAELVRNPTAQNHVLEAGSLGVLVCHDLIAFRKPRAVPVGDRHRANRELQAAVYARSPNVILHLAHTADRAGTWTPSWSKIRDRTAGSSIWATAFRYRTKKNGTPKRKDGTRKPLAKSVLRGLADPSVTSVIVFDPDSSDLVDLT